MNKSERNKQIAAAAVRACGRNAYICAKLINLSHSAEVVASISEDYTPENEAAKSETFAVCLNGVWLIVRNKEIDAHLINTLDLSAKLKLFEVYAGFFDKSQEERTAILRERHMAIGGNGEENADGEPMP